MPVRDIRDAVIYAPFAPSRRPEVLMARIDDAMFEQMRVASCSPHAGLAQCFAETEEVTAPAQPDNRTRQQRRRDDREAKKRARNA